MVLQYNHIVHSYSLCVFLIKSEFHPSTVIMFFSLQKMRYCLMLSEFAITALKLPLKALELKSLFNGFLCNSVLASLFKV